MKQVMKPALTAVFSHQYWRLGDAADRDRGEKGQNEFDAVGRADHDPVACFEAVPGQSAREPPRHPVEIAIGPRMEGLGAIADNQRRLCAALNRLPTEAMPSQIEAGGGWAGHGESLSLPAPPRNLRAACIFKR